MAALLAGFFALQNNVLCLLVGAKAEIDGMAHLA
jgi:hypothetical protein